MGRPMPLLEDRTVRIAVMGSGGVGGYRMSSAFIDLPHGVQGAFAGHQLLIGSTKCDASSR
jgi:hypothetical protein